MQTLCKLYGVSQDNYAIHIKNEKLKSEDDLNFEREIDFYLVNNNKNYKCEVKLMGKGNPESADAVIARDSKIFVADKLSDLNKNQLDSLGVNWVELRSENGYQRFSKVLDNLKISYIPFSGNIDKKLQAVFSEVF